MPRKPAPHGVTRTHYNHGCRCEPCRTLARNDKAAARQRRPRLEVKRSRIDGFRTQRGITEFTPQEEAILIALGHLPARPFTLREIAEIMDITHQGAAYIYQKACVKLRTALADWRD